MKRQRIEKHWKSWFNQKIEIIPNSIIFRCGIRYIVNVTSDLPNYFEKSEQEEMEDGRQQIVYMRIPVDDNCSHNLAQFFPRNFNQF